MTFWFDNDFEIESEYHRKTVVLLLIAHILSLQEVVLRSMFFSCISLNCLLVKAISIQKINVLRPFCLGFWGGVVHTDNLLLKSFGVFNQAISILILR